jgi:hypothetical protein
MRGRATCWRLGLALAAACGSELGTSGYSSETQPAKQIASDTTASRSFEITYTATIPQLPQGARRLDVWLPVPSSDARQTITNLRIDSSLQHEFGTEGEYGNRVLHLWSDTPAGASATLRFNCTRREEHSLPTDAWADVSQEPAPIARLLQPDRLGVIDDRVRSLAAQITAGKSDTQAKARAIYDYVIGHMAYDKIAPGWGNGDTLRACNVGKGNCTDFHALFISLARASGIPARFGIGFQIPAEKQQGPVTGYHCWAEFWLPGFGWVPVDASEAWKDQKLRDFYFGSLDDNRFRLSLGRDIHVPGMKGEPLNYFLSPYAEVDGKPVKAERSVTYSAGVSSAPQ